MAAAWNGAASCSVDWAARRSTTGPVSGALTRHQRAVPGTPKLISSSGDPTSSGIATISE